MLTGSANGSIKVTDTLIRTINDSPVGNVSAQLILHLSPTPRTCIEIDSVQLPADFDELAGSFDITLDSGITFSVRPDHARFERTKDNLFCKGCLTLAGVSVPPLQPGYELTEVQFGLINFPSFLGKEYQPPKSIEEFKKGYQRRDFIKLQAASWVIEVRSLKNTPDIIRRRRAHGGYGLTHEGTIRRSDGKPFSVQQVSSLLEVLSLFLSFARGANCRLTLVVGVNGQGHRVWEMWAAGSSSPWRGHRSWFDHDHGTTLTELFPGFFRHLSGMPLHHPLVMALHWYLLSNETEVCEGSIVLTQAALERLSQELACDKDGRKEGVWIADALTEAGIPLAIPSELRKLAEFMNDHKLKNGPHALVEIRNNLIHSKSKFNTLDNGTYLQARELGLHYVELMLLSIFDYKGMYGKRFMSRWSGQVESVPWADGDCAPCIVKPFKC